MPTGLNEEPARTEQTIELARKTAEKYLGGPNDIILAAVSADDPLNGHLVLDAIRKHDPSGTRTLGVVTTPRTLDWTEDKCLQLAKAGEGPSKVCHLSLGWHVLFERPEGSDKLSKKQRHDEELLFMQTSACLGIPSADRGEFLFREKLYTILLKKTENCLASLISHLEDRVALYQQRLALLGEERPAATDMRNYLANIGLQFQTIATQAIQGHYSDAFFIKLTHERAENTAYTQQRTRHLRSLVRDLNRAFYVVLLAKGGRFEIIHDPGLQPDHTVGVTQGQQDSLSHSLQDLTSLYTVEAPVRIDVADLERIAMETSSVSNMNSLLSSDSTARSFALFQAQSCNWGIIAERHIELCLQSAKSFADQLVAHVAPDPTTAQRLLSKYIKPFLDEKRIVLREKVSELLQHYRSGYDLCPLDTHIQPRQDDIPSYQKVLKSSLFQERQR